MSRASRRAARQERRAARRANASARRDDRRQARLDRAGLRQENRSIRQGNRQDTKSTAYEMGIDPNAWIGDSIGSAASAAATIWNPLAGATGKGDKGQAKNIGGLLGSLEDMPTAADTANNSGNGGGGGDNNMMLIGGAALAALLLFKK